MIAAMGILIGLSLCFSLLSSCDHVGCKLTLATSNGCCNAFPSDRFEFGLSFLFSRDDLVRKLSLATRELLFV